MKYVIEESKLSEKCSEIIANCMQRIIFNRNYTAAEVADFQLQVKNEIYNMIIQNSIYLDYIQEQKYLLYEAAYKATHEEEI